MFKIAEDLLQLRDAIDKWIETLGNAPIGTKEIHDGKDVLGEGVFMDWVIINPQTGEIVGTEADDYEMRKQPNEINAVRFK